MNGRRKKLINLLCAKSMIWPDLAFFDTPNNRLIRFDSVQLLRQISLSGWGDGVRGKYCCYYCLYFSSLFVCSLVWIFFVRRIVQSICTVHHLGSNQ